MPKATFERHPEGLDLEYSHIWDNAVKELKEAGAWSLSKYPLLKLYIRALLEADEAFAEGDKLNGDRAAKRASGLADQLALTMRGRKAAGIGDSDEDAPNQFAEVLNFRRSA